RASDLVTAPDNIAELLFAGRLIEKSKLTGPNLIENDATRRGLDGFGFSIPVNGFSPKIPVSNPDSVVGANAALGHGKFYFGRIAKEREPLAVFTCTARILGKIITPESDVLRRRGNRLAAGRRENVIRSEHQHARFHLSLYRERHVHRHLVAVEVRVVRGANQRMNANSFALDQLRFERLN